MYRRWRALEIEAVHVFFVFCLFVFCILFDFLFCFVRITSFSPCNLLFAGVANDNDGANGYLL